MTANFNWLELTLAVLLALTMFGLGLSVSLSGLLNVARKPWHVVLGLSLQIFMLPLLAIVLSSLFQLEPVFTFGFYLLAVSPGGPSSSLFSFLSGGDVEFNLCLTALNSVLSAITMPAALSLGSKYLGVSQPEINIPLSKFLVPAIYILIPVLLGLLAQIKFRNFAAFTSQLMKPFSLVTLLFLASVIAITKREVILLHLNSLGLSTMLFSIVSIIAAYFIARTVKIERSKSIAISFEVGIHNAALAMFLAVNVFQNSDYTIVPVFYSAAMYLVGAIACLRFRYLTAKVKF